MRRDRCRKCASSLLKKSQRMNGPFVFSVGAPTNEPTQQTGAERQGRQGYLLGQAATMNDEAVTEVERDDGRSRRGCWETPVDIASVLSMTVEQWNLPNHWDWVELENISTVISKGTTPTTLGVSFVAEGIPFLRAEDVFGGAINTHTVRFHIDAKTHDSILSRSQLKPGDLLITIAGTLGRIGYVPHDAPELNCNQAVAFIRLNHRRVDLQFASFACQYEGVLRSLVELRKVGTIGNLNLQQIREFRIPLPPLPEQRRIAAILARADRLRRLRRYALEISESYLQSVFVQMFGDPVTNPMGWNLEELGEKISFLTSGSRGWAKYYAEKGDIFLRIQNVGIGHLLLDDLAYVQPPDSAEGRRTSVRPGDLLLSITADLGRTAVIPQVFPTAYINQHLALIRLKDVDPTYVSGYISSPGGQIQIDRLDREGVKSGLNFDDIRGFRIFVPSLPLQQRFAGIAARYERLRAQQREALRQAEHLFATLLHKAFHGELGGSDEAVVDAALAGEPVRNGYGVEAQDELVQMGLGLE